MSERKFVGSAPDAEQTIRGYLRSRFRGYRDDISRDDSLEYVVDSLGLFELVEFLESSYQFRIPNEEFHPNRFATIGRILQLLEERIADETSERPRLEGTPAHLLGSKSARRAK
jgi:acyl carrier protein